MLKSMRAIINAICISSLLLAASTRASPPDTSSAVSDKNRHTYVSGHFKPKNHPKFVTLASLNIPSKGRTLYLRKATAEALARLIADFRHAHPDAEIWVQSASRTFSHQKWLWERKWRGQTLVAGQNLSKSVADPLQRATKILQYTALPGASRHHWGTDIDFNQVNNKYYEKGNGAVLYQWLKQNAGRYGFCQPYTAGRTNGHAEERWHWSYRPLASGFLKTWNTVYGDAQNFKRHNHFAGSDSAASLAALYMNAINPGCKNQ